MGLDMKTRKIIRVELAKTYQRKRRGESSMSPFLLILITGLMLHDSSANCGMKGVIGRKDKPTVVFSSKIYSKGLVSDRKIVSLRFPFIPSINHYFFR
jgi:hypothetical protein